MTEKSIRDELARTIHAVTDSWDEPLDEVHDVPWIVSAILASPVIRRIQADAIREAADTLDKEFQSIPAWTEAYREGVRTTEWMSGGTRMVVGAIEVLNEWADRIERGEQS